MMYLFYIMINILYKLFLIYYLLFNYVRLFLGYRGKSCNETCPEGTYGENCSNECQCSNGAKCSPESGMCLCPTGWRGQQCDLPCEKNYYGNNCKNECQCKNDAACSPIDGKYYF